METASRRLAAEQKTYAARPGDTLSAIAARFYGNPAMWRDIFALNRDQLQRPEDLAAGMVLRLPAVE
jgi:nucleoid-associated protein YgaU